ncbi:interferon-induced protein 44-like [Plectropomus leopardus]|uniref:interferon-induced protein 44-like n=1 Tax=Plectropomus leopardus TaxID=160734 RepID=UPI001C4A7CE4|nr:interferon-induced protein 44-like [Plectropomus leopardus]
MGGDWSNSQPCPPSPPTFPEEWRKIPWGHPNTDLQFVMDYQPHNNDVQQLRILVYGPIGAGKSSFINSVDSVLKGRICGRAFPYDMTGHSFTQKYQTYKIQRGGPEMLYPFSFTDIMGLERGNDRGICVEDIKLAMMGHINDGYTVQSLNS